MIRNHLLLMVTIVMCLIPDSKEWETPSPHQYHIQTDEGPQRYFRYQTDSGQYRKEKRLEDGTIIGTYAWIDADGILRQRDYIADSAGYRILKTENVFVGRNVNVGDAIKAVKKYPASGGTSVKTNQRPIVTVPFNAAVPTIPTSYIPSTTPPSAISTTTVRPYVGIPQVTFSTTSPDVVVSTTSTETPIVEITPHSYISSTSGPLILQPTINLTSADTYVPPVSTAPIYYESTTSTEQYIPTTPSSTPAPIRFVPTVASVEYISTPKPSYEYVPPIYSKEVDQNSLDYNNPYVRPGEQGYRFQNGPTYPLDQNGRPYSGNGYNSQQSYDGVSVTNDGFRYYIPRAYHEEQTLQDDTRSGSFGYIDPFGIRRVIYYNAAPGKGFQHRKNNRYVGFQATPYDPRPPY